MSNDDKTFTIFWLSGNKEVVTGPTIEEAFSRAGYGGGAIRAIDFFSEGEDDQYSFINGEWTKG